MSGPGIRDAIHLGGYVTSAGPSQVNLSVGWAETRQRYSDGTLVTHRGAMGYEGAAERVSKLTFALAWAALTTDDVHAINEIISYGGPLDFCPWLPITESFAATSGSATSGTLARRTGLSVVSPLPSGAASRYATSARRGGASYSSIVLGTVADYRTPWTCATASSGDRVSITYWPCFRVQIGEGQPTLQLPHVQGQTLTLEEI